MGFSANSSPMELDCRGPISGNLLAPLLRTLMSEVRGYF